MEDHELQQLLQTLEKQKSWNGMYLYKYEGFWIPSIWLKSILSTETYFKARDSDIILSTMPKSGTTWLKALVYSIAKRNVFSVDDDKTHPLLISNPHELVPFLEFDIFNEKTKNPISILENITSPRVFATHMSSNILPASILESASSCKIIYLCRNPLDQFVSERFYLLENGLLNKDDDDNHDHYSIGKSVDLYCNGVHTCGPFWEHMLAYWNAHLKNPDKVLFLKFEDLIEDGATCIKKIAEFIGFPFSREEEEKGLVEKISVLCSFKNLSELEVNKNGFVLGTAKNSSFFRKGKVGDWNNYLTQEMAQNINNVMKIKLEGTGLKFDR